MLGGALAFLREFWKALNFNLFFQGRESKWILPKALKALEMNHFESHFTIYFKTAKKPFRRRFLMTAKIHSDHAFILWSQKVGLLHVYMLAIKQD